MIKKETAKGLVFSSVMALIKKDLVNTKEKKELISLLVGVVDRMIDEAKDD
jgi:hypothetical protein